MGAGRRKEKASTTTKRVARRKEVVVTSLRVREQMVNYMALVRLARTASKTSSTPRRKRKRMRNWRRRSAFLSGLDSLLENQPDARENCLAARVEPFDLRRRPSSSLANFQIPILADSCYILLILISLVAVIVSDVCKPIHACFVGILFRRFFFFNRFFLNIAGASLLRCFIRPSSITILLKLYLKCAVYFSTRNIESFLRSMKLEFFEIFLSLFFFFLFPTCRITDSVLAPICIRKSLSQGIAKVNDHNGQVAMRLVNRIVCNLSALKSAVRTFSYSYALNTHCNCRELHSNVVHFFLSISFGKEHDRML